MADDIVDLRLIGCGEGFAENTMWHLDRADSVTGQLDGTFTRRFTGKGAVIYIWDSGIRPDHGEFVRPEGSNVIGGIDLWTPVGLTPACSPLPQGRCPGDSTLILVHTHGTAVASMAAGRFTGVAPDAKLVSVMAGSTLLPGAPTGQLPEDFVLRGLNRIIEHAWDPSTPPFRTAIVNISGTLFPAGDFREESVEARIRDMIAGVDARGQRDPAGKRFLFVTIAGNYVAATPPNRFYGHCDRDRKVFTFPATRGSDIEGLIVVGGITIENRVWDESCIGDSIDILAPAKSVLVASFVAPDQYRSGYPANGTPATPAKPFNSGTSYAAPYVSGLAALLLEQNPALTPEQLEAIIKSTQSHVADSNETTAKGRVAVVQDLGFAPGPRRRAARP